MLRQIVTFITQIKPEIMDQNVGHEEHPVCKHHQSGYCKYGNQCHKPHNNNICKERVCRDRKCRERHPRACRYFNQNGRCKFTTCAYDHKEPIHENKVDILEIEIKNLKEQLTELSNNMSKMMAKLVNLEVNTDDIQNNSKPEEIQETASTHYEYKCDKCEYKCSKGVTLMKHINTKHPDYISERVKDTSNELKCVLCPDNFDTREDLNLHLSEHLDEIKQIELADLLNGHEVFKCTLCDFSSKNKNSIKNHLVEHVNQSLPADELDSDDN